VRNPLAALAGKKARILYRNPDKSTVLHVEDEHDEILVIVADDGSMSEHRVAGLAGVGAALKAASPYDKVLVPNDAGRKVWTYLEPEPESVVEPEPEPVAAPAPAPGPSPDRSMDPQYEPPREERDTPFTRWLSWGPGNI
jgi:hypothetical protein